MSKYTALPTGWNNNRHRYRPDPAPDIALTRVWPATAHVPGRGDFFAAVLDEAEDTFYVGADAFTTSEEALAVAVARAKVRARMTETAS